jgi:hypothetical protein
MKATSNGLYKTYQDGGGIGIKCMGWDSIIGIVSHCGLDGLGFESWSGQDFPHLSRLTMGPT